MEHYNALQEKGSMIRSDNKWLSASSNGITVGNELLKVKCPDVKKKADGSLFLDPKGSRGYYVQMRIAMCCCGLKEDKLILLRNKDNYTRICHLPYIGPRNKHYLTMRGNTN